MSLAVEYTRYGVTRHGENSGQRRSAAIAHAVDWLVWQLVHGFGTFCPSVAAGGMKRNVWLRTFALPMTA
jgi:hypothetical protein